MEFLRKFFGRIIGEEKKRLEEQLTNLKNENRLLRARLEQSRLEVHRCEGKCAKQIMRLIQFAGVRMLKKYGIGLGMAFAKDGDDFILKSFKVVISGERIVDAWGNIFESSGPLMIGEKQDALEEIKKKKVFYCDDFADLGGALKLRTEHCGRCHKGGKDE